MLFNAGGNEIIEPALIVREEKQDPERFGHKRLVVAGLGQRVLYLLICDLYDRIQHQVPGGGSAQYRHENLVLCFCANCFAFVGADGFAVHDRFYKRFIL